MTLDATMAEETVIGAILLRPECLHAVDLRVDEFQSPLCRNAYEAATNLALVEHSPVDLVTLEAELSRLGRKVPTLADLAEMAARVPTAENVGHYARIVRLAATKRRVLVELAEQRARVESSDLAELVGAIEQMQRSVVKACGVRARFAEAGQLLDAVVARLQADPSGENARVKTGLGAIDRICGGLPYGHPTMIGGRTSNGKTCLMRAMADNIAARNIPVGFVTLEDAPIDLVMWQALRRARVGIERIVQGVITAAEIARIAALRAEMAKLPISYCHEGALDGPQICQRVRQMIATKGIKVAFVDFLQRVKVAGIRPYTEELGEVVNMLCDIATDTGIALVLGSQLNRESEKEKRPPTLIDFQGCGGIEQSAELAILVHRLWRQKRDPSKPRYAKLLEALIAKMKLGEPRTGKLYFEGSFGYLCDPEPGFFNDEMDGALPFCSVTGCERFAIHGEDYCGLHLTPREMAMGWNNTERPRYAD